LIFEPDLMRFSDLRLAELFRSHGEVVDCLPVAGGCISDAWRVQVRLVARIDGPVHGANPPGFVDETSGQSTVSPAAVERAFLVKTKTAAFLEPYQREVEGLRALAAVGAVRVPEPIQVRSIGDRAYLVTEWIESAEPNSGNGAFFETFGRRLAALHRLSVGRRIGSDSDNFLGASRQINRPSDSWEDFVAQNRLGIQIRWATDSGKADVTLRRDVDRVIESLGDLLHGRAEETCLLHGDLWSGNYLRDLDGQPVIFDPASYHGCREAEFGMLLLFGGCPAEFFRGYEEEWPLPSGWRRRAEIYKLYHLLNHLNLFGEGYLSACRRSVGNVLAGV